MNRDELIKDAEAMEEAMGRVADRCDIWQDRIVYALCRAVWHLLQAELRRGGGDMVLLPAARRTAEK